MKAVGHRQQQRVFEVFVFQLNCRRTFLFSLNSKGILRANPSNLGFKPFEFSLHARPMRYYKNILHKFPVIVIVDVIVDVDVIKTDLTDFNKNRKNPF